MRRSSVSGGDAVTRPLVPCAARGCPALVPRGRCPAHAPRPWATRPAGAVQYTSSRAYRRLRLQVLTEEPGCRLCPNPSVEVDHLIPFTVRPDLAEVRSNLRALCHGCHARITAEARLRGLDQ